METVQYLPEKVKLMKRLPRTEPLLQDHTSMNQLDVCDRKYFLRMVLGYAPKRSNFQVALDAGHAYHKFREIIERSYSGELDPNKAKDLDHAYGLGMKYVMKCNLTTPPENTKFSYLDRSALIKCCDFAFEYWKEEKRRGQITVLAIEQPFNLQLPDGSFTSGRADQIIRWNVPWGRDFKFTSKGEDAFKRSIEPNDQGSRYIYSESKLIGERLEGIIFEALHHSFTKTNGLKIEIVPHLSQRTPGQLEAWLDDKMHINRQLQLNREHDKWPMRTHNCSWCDFASVCRKSSEAAMMAELENNFEHKPWDNTKVGQEDF